VKKENPKCGMVKDARGFTSIVVIDNGKSEIYDASYGVWRSGPDFQELSDVAIAQFFDTFVVLGGLSTDEGQRDIYLFNQEEEEFELSNAILEQGRFEFPALAVPSDFFTC
jgi:penicillin V acylase-like amidase (Ntn superfamily)